MKAPSEIMHKQAGPDTVVRIDILEGVRGLLASWVMIGHFIYFLAMPNIMMGQGYPQWLIQLALTIRDGVAPVAIFMIISGFVISHLIVSRKEPYKAYITRRFLRLFPAFACCLLLGVLISPLQSALVELPWSMEPWVHHQADLGQIHRDYAIQNIIAHLTLMHGFIPKSWWPDATGAFIGVGWSIATEWQFYLVAPLLIWGGRTLQGLTVIALVMLFLSPLLPFTGYFEEEFTNESHSLLIFHIQYFFIGGVCYQLWRMWREYLAGSNKPRPQGIILCGSIIALFALAITLPSGIPNAIPLQNGMQSPVILVPNLTVPVWIFVFACLCQIAAKPDGIEARIVQAVGCSEPAQFIGRISYSIYLVHWPIAIILLKFIKSFPTSSAFSLWTTFIVVASLVTIGVSTVLYYFVEAPAIRWGKKLFKEDKPAPDVVGPVSSRRGT
ncbi:MAG TPA: acyltransferase [Chthoniobacteraceae bacterium]|nr:acyltransferase [Chthoniobacteraceae bacterium]